MSQLNIRDLLSKSVTAIKTKLGIDTFTWDEYETKLNEAMQGGRIINIPEQPPTCTENGYTAGVYCNCCDTWISGHELIEARHTDNNSDLVCDICGEPMYIADGECGDNVIWKLNSAGELYITGNGSISDNTSAWKSYKSSIKSITIGDNITDIGANAFNGFSKLNNITLGKDIVNVKEKAFYNCSALIEIKFYHSLRYIGLTAFEGCTKLETIDFSDWSFYGESITADNIPTLYSKYVFPNGNYNNSSYLPHFIVPSNQVTVWQQTGKFAQLSNRIIGG